MRTMTDGSTDGERQRAGLVNGHQFRRKKSSPQLNTTARLSAKRCQRELQSTAAAEAVRAASKRVATGGRLVHTVWSSYGAC